MLAIVVVFAFSIIIGVTGGAMGLGSLFPQLNLIAKPFVCYNGQMTYSRQATEVGSATYHTAKWYCENEGSRNEIEPNIVYLIAGTFYGLFLFAILLLITYLYWNSSVGPAKNDGLRLW